MLKMNYFFSRQAIGVFLLACSRLLLFLNTDVVHQCKAVVIAPWCLQGLWAVGGAALKFPPTRALSLGGASPGHAHLVHGRAGLSSAVEEPLRTSQPAPGDTRCLVARIGHS